MTNLTDSQQVVLSVEFKDAVGNTVPSDSVGTLTWASSDETIVTVTDNGDSTATVVTTGTLGDAIVSVENDHDDDGTDDFSGSLAFSVVAGDVTEIGIVAGEPTSRL